MNQRKLQSISHVRADVNLMVENITGDKNGTTISDKMSVKNLA